MRKSLNGPTPCRRHSGPGRTLASASGFATSAFRTRLPAAVLVALLWGAGLPGTGHAQEAADTVRWRNTSELSFLVNGGNAIQSSLGFRNSLRRTSDTGQLRVDAATFRTDATRIERRAVGAPGDFEVEEERETERTAERWSAQGRYDRNLNRILFASGSTGWERNTFAGFNSRAIVSLGAGARLSREDVWDFKLGAGLTYTFQDDVNPDPDGLSRFGGLRGTLDYEHQLATSTLLEMKWVVDANAQEWNDVRGDLSQSIATSLTDRLALKTTLQLLLDNDPPFQRLPLVTPDGEDTGSTVLVPLGKRDQVISLALVLTL
jgi:putative salt-induced outer membrane protein YdiY